MATELLRTTNDLQHTPAHDLESFIYLLCWIVILYDGPKSQLCKDSSKKLALEGWYEGKDLFTFANNKEGCMSSNSHLHNITKYYAGLYTCVAGLSKLVRQQHQYVRSIHEPTGVNYLTGTKWPLDVENTMPPLTHNGVISILRLTCLYLDGQEPKEKDAHVFQPFCLMKKEYTCLMFGEGMRVCSSTNIIDLGGGHYTKKRRILCCINGPKAL